MPRMLKRERTHYAYWGDVNEVGNDHVRQEVLDFVCPAQQPEQLRDSLTKIVPKARIIPKQGCYADHGRPVREMEASYLQRV